MTEIAAGCSLSSERIASPGSTTMGFAAKKQLEEVFQKLEAERGRDLLGELYSARKYIEQQYGNPTTDTCLREFLFNLSVYTLHFLTDLHAPIPVLTAGLLLDSYLRSTVPGEFGHFLSNENKIGSYLRNVAKLYKLEAQLPWRQSGDTRDFEQNALQHLRQRASSSTELSSESILRAKAQHENHRKLYVSTSKEPDVLLLKLVDRIALLKFLKPDPGLMNSLRISDQNLLQDLAEETLNIHVPIAERLGVWKLKWPLQDLAFRIQNPEEYQKITREISIKRETRELYLQKIIQTISAGLRELGIAAEVSGRPKSIYSIYQKKIAKNIETRRINDLTGVRVVVDNNAIGRNKQITHDTSNFLTAKMKKVERKAMKEVRREAERESAKVCYEVLDYLLSEWSTPIVDGKGIYDEGKVSRDWIIHPKPNGYQSIHTTILYPSDGASPTLPEGNSEQLVEVQIRTKEMHTVAEYGIAAHWLYKEKAKFSPSISKKEKTWNFEQAKHIGVNERPSCEAGTFSEENVFCLTPKGEVLHFPSGATPIDFAYRIHKEIGNRLLSAKVNNKVVSFSYPLKNGDVVEIVTSKGEKGAKGEWLRQDKQFARSRKAKSMIRQWLREHKVKT